MTKQTPDDHPPDERAPDLDTIKSSPPGEAFDNATGRLIPETQVAVTESRFHKAAVHDAVAGFTSVVVVLGLVMACVFAVVQQVPGAAWIAGTCGPAAAGVTLAILGQPPFKPNITTN